MKTDAEIQRAVVHELTWDPQVDIANVGVSVIDGVVTLSGIATSYATRHAAQEAAHRVLGVLDVANDLEVVLPGAMERTDTDIAEAVRHALIWDVLVPHQRIRTTVSNGWVTIEGTVDQAYQRAAAEGAVGNLTGVRGVTNLIQVSTSSPDPDDVRHQIEDALERRAEDAAKRIHVTVVGAKAILSGEVSSWPERTAVLHAAQQAPGISDVESQIRVIVPS